MKTFAIWSILCGSMLMVGGCAATPAYSGHERAQLIGRSIGYEYAQMQDDIDHALLLRPPSAMTQWNVR
jgi:hypothetical protein